MRDWHAFVRRHAARPLSDQAVEELAQHVEDTYAAALTAGRSEHDALDLARAQLEHRPRRLPAAMAAPAPTGAGRRSSACRTIPTSAARSRRPRRPASSST